MECNPLADIVLELFKAKTRHPNFPDDPIHAAAILVEESGELTQAANDFVYAGGDLKCLKEEASQCGAMAVRFLENLNRYEEWKKRKPDTVEFITYDGTPETLPGTGETVLLDAGEDGTIVVWYRFHPVEGRTWCHYEPGTGDFEVAIGDTWAYLPKVGAMRAEASQ